MAHHEGETRGEGAVEVPSEAPAAEAAPGGGGFDFWLLGVLLLVAGLVTVQNVWLRRTARRERGAAGDADG